MHAIQVDHVVKRYKNGVQALNGFFNCSGCDCFGY